MKKVILVLCILFSAVVFANNEIERKTKFFKDTFDGLVKDYSVYLSQIEEKIAENSQLVSNFEKIKAIR